MGWLQDRQMIDAGEAKAMKESLDETLELVEYASRVDRDTSSLSPDARQRVRDALRDLRGS
jgi:energy-coupling factor transporter ATP-binding protein EcfA2